MIKPMLGGVLSLWLVLQSAAADDNSVLHLEVRGVISTVACRVEVNSFSQTVDFGVIHTPDYQQPGRTSLWKDFELSVSSCPAETQDVTVTFAGHHNTSDMTAFANGYGEGFAEDIALQLATRDHATFIPPGGSLTVPVPAGERRAVFALSSRLYTPTGGVTAGRFETIIDVTFEYR